jgi:cyclophilin family peptidyl-prolyl cis-trans isomerase
VQEVPLYEGNPVVHMDVMDGEQSVGRLVFQLRKDVVPRAAENFRQLCTGQHGWGYRGSPLHGVEMHSRVFGGDFFGTGTGGFSIYGDTFEDESFELLHVGPGTLAMRNYGPNTNNSQFYVTLRRTPLFDGSSVVVGYLLEGWEVLERLDKAAKSDGFFRAKHDFRIGACGELPGYAGKPRTPLPLPGLTRLAAGADTNNATATSDSAPAK